MCERSLQKKKSQETVSPQIQSINCFFKSSLDGRENIQFRNLCLQEKLEV